MESNVSTNELYDLGDQPPLGEVPPKMHAFMVRQDRFGKMPNEVENLFKLIEIKILCLKNNLEEIKYGKKGIIFKFFQNKPLYPCLLYTSPSPRDTERSRMPSSA